MRYKPEHYLTEEWSKKREMVLGFRGRKCEQCGSEKDIQVHHKNYKNFGNENPWDLLILCEKCHKKHHEKTFLKSMYIDAIKKNDIEKANSIAKILWSL